MWRIPLPGALTGDRADHQSSTPEEATISIVVEDTLVHALHRASQVLEAELSERLDGLGVTSRQAVMLIAIAEVGPRIQTTLVVKTGVDRSTMTDLLRRLQKCGLIRRARSKIDTRALVVSLTDEGNKVEREARAIIEDVDEVVRARNCRRRAGR